MIGNFAFVTPNKLAGCAHPCRDETPERALGELASLHGITAVVTLSEAPLDATALQGFGLASLHIPVPDFGVPEFEEARQVVDFVRQELAGGGRVVVHCGAGYGRTGMLLACCLVSEEGRPAREAIETVRRLRPGSIETPGQEAFIHEWAARNAES